MDIFFLGEWLRLEGIEMMGSSGKRKIEVRLFGQQEGRTERRLVFWGGQSRGWFFGRTEREKRREKKRDGSRMEDFPAEKEGEAKRVS